MTKEVAEKTIIESLDNAILDMVQNTVENTDKKPKIVRARKKNVQVVQVAEVAPEKIEVETLVVESNIEPAKKAISKPKNAKKAKKLKGFLAPRAKKAEKVSKFAKRTKSIYWNTGLVTSVYNKYKKNLATATLALLMLGFVTATTYVTYAYVTLQDSDIVNAVSQHVVLPTNETPKVYIVQSEKADLFKNPLFKGIEVGDNVLTYTNAGKVVIYRSAEDKIVNIVNLSQ